MRIVRFIEAAVLTSVVLAMGVIGVSAILTAMDPQDSLSSIIMAIIVGGFAFGLALVMIYATASTSPKPLGLPRTTDLVPPWFRFIIWMLGLAVISYMADRIWAHDNQAGETEGLYQGSGQYLVASQFWVPAFAGMSGCWNYVSHFE